MDFTQWLSYFENELAPSFVAGHEYHTFSYQIAGKVININLSNLELADSFLLALEHNKIAAKAISDLNIYVWQRSDFNFSFDNEIVHTNKDANNFYYVDQNSISVYLPEKKQAFFWINELKNLKHWVYASPFRNIFHWYFSEFNLFLLHGAVVGIDGESVLITAKGGSGKSTTAMSCIQNGLEYLADDYVIVSSDNLNAYSLYSSLKLNFDNKYLSKELLTQAFNKDSENEEKAIIFLNKLYEEKIRHQSKLKAIFVPQIANKENSEIVEISKSQVLLALLPTTIKQNKHLAEELSSAIKNIVLKLPCHKMYLGSDATNLVDVVKNYLSKSA